MITLFTHIAAFWTSPAPEGSRSFAARVFPPFARREAGAVVTDEHASGDCFPASDCWPAPVLAGEIFVRHGRGDSLYLIARSPGKSGKVTG